MSDMRVREKRGKAVRYIIFEIGRHGGIRPEMSIPFVNNKSK